MDATCKELGVGYVFKASFDKANRTSSASFRGQGMAHGLDILRRINSELNIPTITDIHLPEHAAPVAEVVDILQIPAFLCRQTDLLAAAAATGVPTNIKKGQFLAPQDMAHVTAKFRALGGRHVAVTERGTTFGYQDLVVDMRGLVVMRQVTDAPVIFDATHSVQKPGALVGSSGGDRTLAPPLARAAAAVGIDGLFCEVHPEPDKALSDGPNTLCLDTMASLVAQVVAIDQVSRKATHKPIPPR